MKLLTAIILVSAISGTLSEIYPLPGDASPVDLQSGLSIEFGDSSCTYRTCEYLRDGLWSPLLMECPTNILFALLL